MAKKKTAAEDVVIVERFEEGVAVVTLNRPELHNAFDDGLIAKLTAALEELGADPEVRVILLAANGKSFSAGADLNWMKRMAGYSEKENLRDARALGRLMRTLNDLPKPVVARVQGAAFGGGVGLISACDVAIASQEAVFAVSEVRLGLIPAVISPYVVAAIGPRRARRLFLTGERFDASEAWRIGLVHDIVEADELDATVQSVIRDLLACGPNAVSAAKNLIARVSNSPLDDDLVEDTARRIAAIRSSPEGKDGVSAFLEKRNPAWITPAPKARSRAKRRSA